MFACNSSGMITIPAGTLSGTQIVQAAGGANTSTTNSGQGTVTVTLPVSGNMVSAGGMVMVSAEIHYNTIQYIFITPCTVLILFYNI